MPKRALRGQVGSCSFPPEPRGGYTGKQSDCRMEMKLILGLEGEEGQDLDLKADCGSN